MDKSFINHYLIDDDKQVLSYGVSGKLNLLNAFEKCLLLEVLMRNNENKQVQSIIKQMKERVAEMNESHNAVENGKKIFELVLKMYSTSK